MCRQGAKGKQDVGPYKHLPGSRWSQTVGEFGPELVALRQRHHLTQQGLVDSLADEFARSTIANIERGREAPTPRLWAAIRASFPQDVAVLAPAYQQARRRMHRPASAAPPTSGTRRQRGSVPKVSSPEVVIESRHVAAVFRTHPAPEELIQTIHLRSRWQDVTAFPLTVKATHTEGFRIDSEVLWGGRLADIECVDRAGATLVLRSIEFDHPLQRGEHHSVALRSWIESDPDPEPGIDVTITTPCKFLAIHLAFLGPAPDAVWAWGPLLDDALAPRSPTDPHALAPESTADGRYSAIFVRPDLGHVCGVEWHRPD